MPVTPARTRILFVSAIAVFGALAASAEPARGGPYNAALCDAAIGAWHADASFSRSSRHYGSAADCGAHGAGLSVTHDAHPAAPGAWGAWSVRAAAGTRITRIAARAGGRRSGGQAPELLAGPLRDPVDTFARPGP